MGITVIALLFPYIKNLRLGGKIFTRPIIWSDLLGGGLLMLACSFVGGMVGGLFHNRIIHNTRLNLVLTSIIALLSLCRNGIVITLPFTKFILWIVPPVSDVVSWFSNENYFDIGNMMKGFLLLMLYGVILAGIKVELLRKRKF